MTEEPAPRASQAPLDAQTPTPAPEVGPAPSRPPQDDSAPREPVDACRHCPIPERSHAQRWTAAVGWHGWTQPTQEQTKARMIARRITKETHA